MRGIAAIDITSQTYTSPELRDELISPVSLQVFRPLSGLSSDVPSPQFMLPLAIDEPRRVIARICMLNPPLFQRILVNIWHTRDHVNITISY